MLRQRGSTAEHDDAYPYQQLAVLAFCRLAEPVAFVSITAYTFVMVQEIKGDEDASFYAGLLISAFAMAEASTAMIWGSISDRYGRKPIVLIGLAGTALSSLLFGFAKRYWVALLARALGGFLNGNVAVMQTMVAEMVKKPEHEPSAYAVQPFIWSLGSIAGSALGGFTAQPARFYPHLFSPEGIFGQYPYLLPNLIAVTVIVVAMIQGWLFLEETNPPSRPRPVQAQSNSADTTDETTPLRPKERRGSALDALSGGPGGIVYVAGSAPIPNDPAFDIRRSSFTSISSFKVLVKVDSSFDAVFDDVDEESTSEIKHVKAFNNGVIMWTIALALMCYHQMAFGTLIPVYLLDDPRTPPHELDLEGGLGMTLHTVGTYLAVASLMSLFAQGVIFPVYVAKLGVWKAAVSLTLICPLIHIAVPFVSLLPNPGVGIYIILALQSFASVITYPTLLILLKNATESASVLGKVNGLAMSLCSAARTIGPPLTGMVYSGLGSGAAWWSCALVSIACVVQLYFTPRPKDGDATILGRASIRTAEAPALADDERYRAEQSGLSNHPLLVDEGLD